MGAQQRHAPFRNTGPEMPDVSQEMKGHGMSEIELVPALQLEDQDMIERALACLKEAAIEGDSVPVAQMPPASLPAWAQPKSGGWFLRIRKDRVEEGMKALEPVMGYTPD